MPRAVVVYNNGASPKFVPHPAGVLIWQMMNGEVEIPADQAEKISRVKIVYLNHKLAPESYRVARGLDAPPGPQQISLPYKG